MKKLLISTILSGVFVAGCSTTEVKKSTPKKVYKQVPQQTYKVNPADISKQGEVMPQGDTYAPVITQ